MKQISKDTWIVILTLVVFLVWKLATLHFRFGDENVYFYMTKAIRGGLVPYKDFNLADPPAFIYLLTGFSALIGKHFILFKIWPPLFDAGNAVLVFLILKKLGNTFAAFGPAAYLFSFTVLSTSDYVTGAEAAIFFMLLAIYLDLRGKPAWSGVSWALACLSKLYIAPALLAYLGYKLWRRDYRPVSRIIIAGAIIGAAVLLPFFFIAPHQTLANLLLYQFHRPAGLDKGAIFGTFFQMEWFLILVGVTGTFLTRHKALVLPLAASLVFLIWFKDLYYLYLHLLIPFLAIFAAESLDALSRHKSDFAWALIAFWILVTVYPIVSYTRTFAPQGVFDNPQEAANSLLSASDTLPVYGVQEAAPLVALMADRPIFENVIDTNTQNFLSGALNEEDISKDAVKHGVYLVARVADYPAQGVTDEGFEAYFSKADFGSCTRYATFPRPTPLDVLNDVVIYRCGSGK